MGAPSRSGRRFAMPSRSGRHSAKPFRNATRGVLSTTAVFAGAIVLAVAATGTTYALWNDDVAPGGSAVATGETGLTVENVSDYVIPNMDLTKLYPGTSAITSTPLTVTNTGSTPLIVTPAPATFTNSVNGMSGHLAVALRPAASCVVSPVGVTPVSTVLPRLEVGQSTQVCVEVRLLASAPASVQGGSATFTVQLDAVQVR